MHKVPSSVFRLTYTTLTEPAEVTANGSLTGTWLPAGTVYSLGAETMTESFIVSAPPRVAAPEGEAAFIRPSGTTPPTTAQPRPERTSQPTIEDSRFNTAPFTPVPKGAKR